MVHGRSLCSARPGVLRLGRLGAAPRCTLRASCDDHRRASNHSERRSPRTVGRNFLAVGKPTTRKGATWHEPTKTAATSTSRDRIRVKSANARRTSARPSATKERNRTMIVKAKTTIEKELLASAAALCSTEIGRQTLAHVHVTNTCVEASNGHAMVRRMREPVDAAQAATMIFRSSKTRKRRTSGATATTGASGSATCASIALSLSFTVLRTWSDACAANTLPGMRAS